MSALSHDPKSLEAAAASGLPVMIMHAQGDPKTMNDDPQYDDVVLDVFDYLAARIAACVAAGVPLVSGALGRWSGQVGVFAGRPCYRCLVPDIPPESETCARVGVIGALAGVVGSMAALETVKLITAAGQPLTGRLMLYDGLAGTARTVTVTRDPACPACG